LCVWFLLVVNTSASDCLERLDLLVLCVERDIKLYLLTLYCNIQFLDCCMYCKLHVLWILGWDECHCHYLDVFSQESWVSELCFLVLTRNTTYSRRCATVDTRAWHQACMQWLGRALLLAVWLGWLVGSHFCAPCVLCSVISHLTVVGELTDRADTPPADSANTPPAPVLVTGSTHYMLSRAYSSFASSGCSHQ